MSKINFILGFILILISVGGCINHKKETSHPDYTLVWADEFETDGAPDSTKWSFDTKGNEWAWGNNEKQFYTKNDSDNAFIKNGILYITALKEESENKGYTSARLITQKNGGWLYGIVEVKARIPKGRGIWPAIWMMPVSSEYGNWPASGEIDIMEHVGYMPDSVFATVHTQSYNHGIGTQKGKSASLQNIYDDFHVYKLEWEPEQYTVYFDDTKIFTFVNEKTGYKEWPFDKPFYLILNVAVGGNWGGKMGINDSIFPQSMEVDYVRVYQKRKQ